MFFCMFFNAKILREPRNCQVLFWTDLCAKNGVRMIAYHNKKLESKFEVDFENPHFDHKFRSPGFSQTP